MRFFGDARPKRTYTFPARSHLDRMKKYGMQVGHTTQQWHAVLEFQNFRCFYCHVHLEMHTWSRDHKIPLARGGSDDISNIVAACRSCNSKKHTMTTEEFINKNKSLCKKKEGVKGEPFFCGKLTTSSLSSVTPKTSPPKSELKKTVEREVAAFEAQRNYHW